MMEHGETAAESAHDLACYELEGDLHEIVDRLERASFAPVAISELHARTPRWINLQELLGEYAERGLGEWCETPHRWCAEFGDVPAFRFLPVAETGSE